MSVTGAQGTGGTVAGASKWLNTGQIVEYHGAGNFLAFHITPGDDGATTEAGIVPAEAGLATLDDDGLLLVKITDTAAEQLEVVTTLDGETLTQTFSLEGVTLEGETVLSDLAIIGGGTIGAINATMSDPGPFPLEVAAYNETAGHYYAVDRATAVINFADAGIGEIIDYPDEPNAFVFEAKGIGTTTVTITARDLQDHLLHTGTATVTVTE